MLTLPTILRDAAVAGLVLALLGCVKSTEVGGAVAAGALGSLVNLFLLRRALSGAGVASDAWVHGRLGAKTIFGAMILVVLLAKLPAGPVLLGFCSVLFGLFGRACALLWAGTGTSTPEPG